VGKCEGADQGASGQAERKSSEGNEEKLIGEKGGEVLVRRVRQIKKEKDGSLNDGTIGKQASIKRRVRWGEALKGV